MWTAILRYQIHSFPAVSLPGSDPGSLNCKINIHPTNQIHSWCVGGWGCRFHTLPEEEWVQKHFIIQWVFPDIQFVFREDWNCGICFLSASVVDVFLLFCSSVDNRFDAVTLTSRGHQLQTGIYCSCSLCESDLIYSVNKMMQNCVMWICVMPHGSHLMQNS